MDKRYSVLMSVYEKEKPEYLRAALMSMLEQTHLPYEIVVVCDGPLTSDLEKTLAFFAEHLTLVRLRENGGLGKALAEGLQHCNCEWVVRMDSDDIADSRRCEKQFKYIREHSEIDVLSGAVAEFTGDWLTVEDAQIHTFACKNVPVTEQEIVRYIKHRNPINHPCVVFRKSKVLAAGSYQPCDLFEDYDLWVRMYLKGCKFANLPETILYMRVNDLHKRRGGLRYAKAVLHFWTSMYYRKMTSFPQYICMVVARVTVSLLPNRIRKLIYDRKLRNR